MAVQYHVAAEVAVAVAVAGEFVAAVAVAKEATLSGLSKSSSSGVNDSSNTITAYHDVPLPSLSLFVPLLLLLLAADAAGKKVDLAALAVLLGDWFLQVAAGFLQVAKMVQYLESRRKTALFSSGSS